MERINLDNLQEAIKTANELLNSVEVAAQDLDRVFNRCAEQSHDPATVKLIQAKCNRIINKALNGKDVTADIKNLKNEFKDIK